ncbi:ArsR/SmtB family transcription factor [Dactylosporangium sp. NPDC051541]|uniref:ArsR/SmtB family transcription factor n=1 Tax=Dactylosporangium sp. NPDC051541 TaxID=3363977 RepID=UPI00379C6CB5
MHLTSADIGRVRLLSGPNPLLETLASAVLLREQTDDPLLRRWRVETARMLGPACLSVLEVTGSRMVTASDLVARHTPALEDFDEAVESILATPNRVITRDLALVANRGRPDRIEHDLRAGSRHAIRNIASTLQHIHKNVIAPRWERSVLDGHAGFIEQRRRLAEQGVDRVLQGLHPSLTWERPVLTLDLRCKLELERWGPCPLHPDTVTGTDFYLEGRGLLLVPAVFTADPLLFVDDVDDQPGIVFYPTLDSWAGLLASKHGRTIELAPVLGRTRAAIVAALSTGPLATSALARIAEISVPSASEHAAALRGAGLVVSAREGKRVIHCLSETGAALLRGSV